MKPTTVLLTLTVLATTFFTACHFLGKTGKVIAKNEMPAKKEHVKYVHEVAVNDLATEPEAKLVEEQAEMKTIPVVSESQLEKVLITKPRKKEKLSDAEAREMVLTAKLPNLVSSSDDDYMRVRNGFIGKDNYRIEVFIDKVVPDADNSMHLTVTGKTRYKKHVLPFSGTMDITAIHKIERTTRYYDYYQSEKHEGRDKFDSDTFVTYYQASGVLKLGEDKTKWGAGAYNGKFVLDFNKHGVNEKEYYAYDYNTNDETRGAGLFMQGNWVSYANNATKNFIAGHYFLGFANQVLNEFYYGEREMEINEKYRALGWDDYWENPEWWADEEQEEANTETL